LEAEIKGLDIMNDDPTRARVLYACASSDKLPDVANALAKAMSDTGLAPEQDTVKLHVTLLNVRYASYQFQSDDRKRRMDVSRLLEKYRDYEFGKVVIPEVHISRLIREEGSTDYYTAIGIFPLNASEKSDE
uniref:AKAP7_NLS domain-containing protein n=1 Tax=Gongylonema pulchrum TaxID=637853 RepID=A0A183EGB3_9BILA